MSAKIFQPSDGPVILGIDPGLAHLGWAAVQVKQDPTKDAAVILDGGVITTEKSSALQSMLASEDAVMRMQEQYRMLQREVQLAVGYYSVGALAAESISFPRNAGSAAKIGMSWGVISSFAYLTGLPLLQASPQRVKKFVAGKRSASKEEVEEGVKNRAFGGSAIALKLDKGDQEHFWDAAAVALAVADYEVVKLLRRRAA